MAVLLNDALASSRTRARPWLWFNLLSIDAPLVAVVWQLWFAHCSKITLTPFAVVVLALTVWIIYATDRLLDVRGGKGLLLKTERHRFHREHSRALLIAVASCILFLAATIFRLNPILIRNGLVLTAIVALYFSAIHLFPAGILDFCPKELAVGVVFAAGAALAPWSRLRHSGSLLLPVALFAMLCVLNCAAIETWEWKAIGEVFAERPHPFTIWLSTHLRMLSGLIAAASSVLLVMLKDHIVFAPIIVSATAFLWLDVERERLPISLARVLVDLPLLSPLLILRLH